jgi:hypothetical protein
VFHRHSNDSDFVPPARPLQGRGRIKTALRFRSRPFLSTRKHSTIQVFIRVVALVISVRNDHNWHPKNYFFVGDWSPSGTLDLGCTVLYSRACNKKIKI